MMSQPHRTRYYLMTTTWTGLRRKLLELRTALPLDLNGPRARFIARSLGGRYLADPTDTGAVRRPSPC